MPFRRRWVRVMLRVLAWGVCTSFPLQMVVSSLCYGDSLSRSGSVTALFLSRTQTAMSVTVTSNLRDPSPNTTFWPNMRTFVKKPFTTATTTSPPSTGNAKAPPPPSARQHTFFAYKPSINASFDMFHYEITSPDQTTLWRISFLVVSISLMLLSFPISIRIFHSPNHGDSVPFDSRCIPV